MKKILVIIFMALLLSACEKEQPCIGPEIMPIDSLNPNVPLYAETNIK